MLFKDSKSGDDKLFSYVGHVTKDEINNYLCQATAMLFTSTWDEPYGLTLAESLACGTPVIGFDAGASAEIITSETGVIVPKKKTKPPLSMVLLRLKIYHAKPAVTVLYSFVQCQPW